MVITGSGLVYTTFLGSFPLTRTNMSKLVLYLFSFHVPMNPSIICTFVTCEVLNSYKLSAFPFWVWIFLGVFSLVPDIPPLNPVIRQKQMDKVDFFFSFFRHSFIGTHCLVLDFLEGVEFVVHMVTNMCMYGVWCWTAKSFWEHVKMGQLFLW